MALNLNTNPYYDDFDEKKNYHRILFRPGFAVQARELTQLQTQLSDQISKFGKHVFRNGAIVIGGNRYFDTEVKSIKLETTYNGTAIDYTLFVNKTIVGETSGTKALVSLAIGPTSIDPLTFIVKIIDGGTSGTGAFTAGERIYTNDTNAYSAKISPGSFLNNAMTFSIDSGIFFVNGNFVYLEPQAIYLDKYSNTSSISVGIEAAESIVTSNDDDSILDASQGTSNYTAPGADRLKISLNLVTKGIVPAGNFVIGKTYEIAESGSTDFSAIGATDSVVGTQFIATGVGSGSGTAVNIIDNLYEIARVVNGKLVVNKEKTVYSTIGDELARRTFDESGHYTVDRWKLQLKDNESTIAGTFVAEIEPGKGYVKGYEFKTEAQVRLTIDKTRDASHIQQSTNKSTSMYFGNYVYVTNLGYGTGSSGATLFSTNNATDASAYTAVELHNTAKSGTINAGTKVGTARVRFVRYDRGTVGTTTGSTGGALTTPYTAARAVYRMYLFNITMTSGTFKGVRSILTNSGTYTITYGVDIDPLSQYQSSPTPPSGWAAGDVFLTGNNAPSLVYQLPSNYIKSLVDKSNTKTAKFYSQKTFTASSPSATGFTITTVGYERFYPATSSSDRATHFHVVKSDGVVVNLDSATITFGGAGTDSATQTATFSGLASSTYTNAVVIATTQIISAANYGQKTKTLNNYNKKIITSPNTTLGGLDNLGVSDIYDVLAVYNIGAGDTTTTPPTVDGATGVVTWGSVGGYQDVTSRYTVDNGQRDEIYDYGNLVLTGAAPSAGDKLFVVYRNFAHTGNGYFSVDSYPSSSAQGYSPYADIPRFKSPSTGVTVELRDTIDFRPRKSDASATTFTGGQVPVPVEALTTDYQFYMGRFDKVIATTDKQFIDIKGVPGIYPKVPLDIKDAMTLFVLAIPPYVESVSDIQIKYIDNKRYTMRDIGKLEKRINTLEYYTQLSLLEKAAKDTSIPDSSMVEKFKQGFAVDPFTSQDIFNINSTAWVERRWGWWNTWLNGSSAWSIAAQKYADNSIADATNPDFNAAIDPYNAELRAPLTVVNYGFTYADDKKGADNTSQSGDLVTLDYTEGVYISQLLASTTANVNPFNVVRFVATIVLEPPFDNWIDTTYLPSINKIVDVTMPDITESYITDTGSGTVIEYEKAGATTVKTTVTDSSTVSLGTNVIDVQAVPWIRPRAVFGFGRLFKPKATLYPFVEGVSIGSYTRPLTQLKLQNHVGTLFNDQAGVYETVEYRYGSITGTVFKRARAGLYTDVTTADTTARILSVFDDQVSGSPAPEASPDVSSTWTGPVYDQDSVSICREDNRFVPGMTYLINQLGTTNWIGGTSATDLDGVAGRDNAKAVFTGTISGNQILTVASFTSGSGTLAVGQAIYGYANSTAIPAGTIITGLLTGRGGVGTYKVNTPTLTNTQTATSTTNSGTAGSTAINITAASGTIRVGMEVVATVTSGGAASANIQPGTTILSGSGTSWVLSQPIATTWSSGITLTMKCSNIYGATVRSLAKGDKVKLFAAAFTATQSTTTLTVTAINSSATDSFKTGGVIKAGQKVYTAAGTLIGTIQAYGTSSTTGTGSTGTYAIDLTGAGGTLSTSTRCRSIFVNPSSVGTGSGSHTNDTNPIVDPSPDTTAIYVVGTKTGGYATLAANGITTSTLGSALVPDEFGNIAYEWQIQANKFKTGERNIRLIDRSNNDLTVQESLGEVKYTALGEIVTKQETTLQTRTSQKVTRFETIRNWYDPLAQTFQVDSVSNPQGLHLTSVDVFFATKSSTIPVTMEIRRTINGYPSNVCDIQGGEVVLNPSQVNISTDSSVATTFRFPSPIHLVPGDYAIVLVANTQEYNAYVSDIGGTVIGGTAKIDKQPYTGSLFKSQNGATWEPDSNKDLKFVLRRGQFLSSGSAIFNIKDPKAIKDYNLLHIVGKSVVPTSGFSDVTGLKTKVDWYAKTTSTASVVDSAWTPININQDTSFETLRRFAGTTDDAAVVAATSLVAGNTYTILVLGTTNWNTVAGTTGVTYREGDTVNCVSVGTGTGKGISNSLQLKAVLTSSDVNVSPAIDVSALAVVGVVNNINDSTYGPTSATTTIRSGANIINNVPADAFLNINYGMKVEGTGIPSSTVVTGIDAYHKAITISNNATADSNTTALTFTQVETTAAGGGAIARYITKVINLASGFDASNLCVTTDINRPVGTKVEVYYRALAVETTTPMNQQPWILMNQEKTIQNSITDFDFREYRFFPTGAFDTYGYPTNAPISPRFNAFQVKIVMLSSNKALSPRFKNLRIIALDA